MPRTVQGVSRQLGRKKHCHCVLSPPGGEGRENPKSGSQPAAGGISPGVHSAANLHPITC
jgi:hypothetical protein